jgi:hypothetical protein
MEMLSLAVAVAGLGWMAGLLAGGLTVTFHVTWPPVRLGRPRRSTWHDVMGM